MNELLTNWKGGAGSLAGDDDEKVSKDRGRSFIP